MGKWGEVGFPNSLYNLWQKDCWPNWFAVPCHNSQYWSHTQVLQVHYAAYLSRHLFCHYMQGKKLQLVDWLKTCWKSMNGARLGSPFLFTVLAKQMGRGAMAFCKYFCKTGMVKALGSSDNIDFQRYKKTMKTGIIVNRLSKLWIKDWGLFSLTTKKAQRIYTKRHKELTVINCILEIVNKTKVSPVCFPLLLFIGWIHCLPRDNLQNRILLFNWLDTSVDSAARNLTLPSDFCRTVLPVISSYFISLHPGFLFRSGFK